MRTTVTISYLKILVKNSVCHSFKNLFTNEFLRKLYTVVNYSELTSHYNELVNAQLIMGIISDSVKNAVNFYFGAKKFGYYLCTALQTIVH